MGAVVERVPELQRVPRWKEETRVTSVYLPVDLVRAMDRLWPGRQRSAVIRRAIMAAIREKIDGMKPGPAQLRVMGP